ncbi:MAG: chromosomal replication initiator protein DnaA [Eggerthellaceae bacterium]|nr:chromosomal replication initiator protein DnaA [Eggerthellaceae bacterium]
MNSEELREQWSRVYETVIASDGVDASQATAFLSRLQPQAMSDGFIMLTADNSWLKNWIEGHYVDHIRKALREIHGKEYVVAIEVDENQAIPEPTAATTARTTVPEPVPAPATTQTAQPIPEPTALEKPRSQKGASISESMSDTMLAPMSSLTFENFVIGESNRMAYSMAVAVAEEPGRSMLNPLFIYGKSGLGKTHLMRAIQNYVAETRPKLQTVYVDSADFLSGYVEAAIGHDRQKTSFKTFKNRYQEADILLIDDIQYLQGKEQTLDIVFQIFNTMVDQGKQVVLSADRAPKNITMDERYQSRFNMGGTFDIQPPETETKLGIITSFVEEYRTSSAQGDFQFPDEIARYIAENSSSNIRELKSAVTKVIYSMNAFGADDITIDRVSQLLENHFSGGAMKKLVITDIQKQVEQYYGISHPDLVGQKRDRRIAYARKIAVYLSREMLDLPYNSIGKSFGGRDHTTIMYSVRDVEKQMKQSREIREEIENVKKRIKEM